MLTKLDLNAEDLFADKHQLIKSWVDKNSSANLSLISQKNKLIEMFDDMSKEYTPLDSSLDVFFEAQKQQQLKAISNIEQRLMKLSKTKLDVQVNQINKLYDELFPNQSLQERQVSFMEFYLSNGSSFIQYLINELDPLEQQFSIIELS